MKFQSALGITIGFLIEWAQVVQRCCGVSIHGDIRNRSGHAPGQATLVVLAWTAEGLDYMTSRWYLQI